MRRLDEEWAQLRAVREERGEDVSFSPLDLWFDNDGRPDSAEWFAAHGWITPHRR
jgi:hypothetical protein